MGSLHSKISFDKLRAKVEDAIGHIYRDEGFLIENGLSEWTISAQFHYWVRQVFMRFLSGYDYDSEYNYMSLIDDKQFAKKVLVVEDDRLVVRPDFIIHKRGTHTKNLLWVEIKRRKGKGWKSDLNRVRAVTQDTVSEHRLEFVTGYLFGLAVLFTPKKITCCWFSNGRPLCEWAAINSSGNLMWTQNQGKKHE